MCARPSKIASPSGSSRETASLNNRIQAVARFPSNFPTRVASDRRDTFLNYRAFRGTVPRHDERLSRSGSGGGGGRGEERESARVRGCIFRRLLNFLPRHARLTARRGRFVGAPLIRENGSERMTLFLCIPRA